MIDWTASMQRTYEYYVVDPITWMDVRQLHSVKSSTIDKDLSSSTLCTATFEMDDDIGEEYIRIYMIAVQDRVRYRFPLGTFITQSPGFSFDGRVKSMKLDGYSPLVELKEKKPPMGYFVNKGENIMSVAQRLTADNMRGPVGAIDYMKTLEDVFVADPDESYLEFLSKLMAKVNYGYSLTSDGSVIFSPFIETAALEPRWIYNDDNSSILQPSISYDGDIYGIPNVVEVIYSNATSIGSISRSYVVENNSENSITSIKNRGRKILYRETNPNVPNGADQASVEAYAKRLLTEKSAINCKVTYTHAYCPVNIGDGVLINYASAGIRNLKAKVLTQSITCDAAGQVSETAVFTKTLYGDGVA